MPYSYIKQPNWT